MKNWESLALRIVRWSGWPLLFLTFGFLITGYIISGRYGLGVLMTEAAALAFHKLLHIPLGILLVIHVVPPIYLALKRWRWIKK